MKKYIVGVIVAIGIPLILEFCIFSNNFASRVSNDGWASFFGGYIGGIATLLAVFLTIDDNRKTLSEQRQLDKEKEEERTRLGVMPYIQTSHNFYDETAEVSPQDIIYMIDEGVIKYRFTNGEKHILETYKNDLEYCFLKYVIRNVGAGSAIEVTIKVNDEDYGVKQAIPQNEKIVLYMWKHMGKNSSCSIRIDMDFWDTVMMGHYYRREKFDLKAEDDEMRIGKDESYYVSQTLYEGTIEN